MKVVKILSLFLGICCLSFSSLKAQMASGYVYVDENNNGKRDRKEATLPQVMVSNGLQVVSTDAKGRYEIPVSDDQIIFVIKPSGYGVPVNEYMLPQYYYIHKPAGSPKSMKYKGVDPTGPLPKEINFALLPQAESEQFRAMVFGDPQVYSQQDLDWFRKGIIEEVKGIQGISLGITLGDLVGDDLDLFSAYKKEMSVLGIPWYNMVGNHDLNYETGIDSLTDESFEAHFGPANYAFNYGNAHFIVLDNVLSPDPRKNSGYWGGLREDQLEFVKNDLAHTDTSKLIVFAYHIPMNDGDFRKEDRDKLFAFCKHHPHVLMMCGHTHMQEQTFYSKADGWPHAMPAHEYNAGTTSGDWYSGELNADHVPYATMRDGTEKGYAFLNVDGNHYSIDYKVAGKSADYQMSFFVPNVLAHRRDERAYFYTNFFMGSKHSVVKYRVDGGKWSAMEFYPEVDPTHYMNYTRWDLTTELMPGRRPSMPVKSPHLWRGSVSTELPVGKHVIEVSAQDPFGRDFRAERTFMVENPKSLPAVR